MSPLRYQLVILVLLLAEGVILSTILSKSADIVLENSTLTLTCSKKDGELVETKWKSSTFPDQEAGCARVRNRCLKTFFLNNTPLYDCSCNGNGTYSVILRHVNRKQHGAIWSCREIGFLENNTVVVKVAVPVTWAMLQQTDNSSVTENSSAVFQCNTSYNLPPAAIHWYSSKGSSIVELSNSLDGEVHITRKQYARDDNLISVEETLTYRVNRSVHGWSVYCTASNWENYQVTSNRIVLSVIYPPARPPVINYFLNGSTYKVIENTIASLSCSIEGGNPLARAKWVCLNLINNRLVEITDNMMMTSNLSWTATRDQGKTCSCQTDHILSKDFTFVLVNVLYPPMFLTLQAQYQNIKQNVTADVTLIEGKTYSLHCSADGNPPPTRYIWSGPQKLNISNNGSLVLSNVQRNQNGTYSCIAYYVMMPTYGGNRNGNKSTSVYVDILYKPAVAILHNHDVTEGSSLNVSCIAISSNPKITDVVWTRDKNDLIIHSNPLILQNISRYDSMNYTCTMKNEMSPTVGSVEVGQDRKSFSLNVWFKSVVQLFSFLGYEGQQSITVNENQSVKLQCDIVRSPGSIITLYFDGKKEIYTALDVKTLSYSLEHVSCLQAGFYTCTAVNDFFTDQPSTAILLLHVRCPPKRYPGGVITKVYARPNSPATFTFTVMAYPLPGPSGFSWYKQTGFNWTVLSQSSKYDISSSALQTNLTIKSVTDVDYGEYMVRITNSLGKHEETFSLMKAAEDLPDRSDNSARVVNIVLGCILSLVVIIGATVLIVFKYRRYKMEKRDDNEKTGVGLYDEMQTFPDRRLVENTDRSYEQLTTGRGATGSTNTVYTNLTV